jgi:hypothetical protein
VRSDVRGGEGLKIETNLDEEGTRKPCPNEKKVWGVRHVPDGVHIVQPYIEQGEGSFHALCARHHDQNEMRCWRDECKITHR